MEKCLFNVGSYGWGNLKCDNNNFPFSYLTDVPLEMLEEIDGYLNTKMSMSILLDGEGFFNTLVVNQYRVYVISEKNTEELIKLNVSPENFIKQVVSDVKKQLVNIYQWNESEEDAEEYGEIDEFNKRKEKINELIKKIEERIIEMKW